MDKHSKKAVFVGGPLDGQTRTVESNQSIFRHEQPPLSDDIIFGEIPVGFFPPIHEYVYHEQPEGSGTFVLGVQLHQ